jgi:glycosyltransferase involved in cell wall biosynthesis
MIEAMPAIVERCPDAVYVVMGATHPHLLRDAGESYRLGLMERVEELGLGNHVVFLNRFAERPELLDHIAMCDVYVTPYRDEAQMTSGTLAYAHGLGRAVVSTPIGTPPNCWATDRACWCPLTTARAWVRPWPTCWSTGPRGKSWPTTPMSPAVR